MYIRNRKKGVAGDRGDIATGRGVRIPPPAPPIEKIAGRLSRRPLSIFSLSEDFVAIVNVHFSLTNSIAFCRSFLAVPK
jgi:hypothetical protein